MTPFIKFFCKSVVSRGFVNFHFIQFMFYFLFCHILFAKSTLICHSLWEEKKLFDKKEYKFLLISVRSFRTSSLTSKVLIWFLVWMTRLFSKVKNLVDFSHFLYQSHLLPILRLSSFLSYALSSFVLQAK